MFWRVRNRKIFFHQTLLMGILNLTPDSFSDGGKFQTPDHAFSQALKMMEEGASILDLGAESTRPQAEPVSAGEELARLLPVLEKMIAVRPDILISIDTTKPEVASACLEKGAHIINDVSGLKDSGADMAEAVKKFNAGLILMHRRGNPKTMQDLAVYKDVAAEVKAELEESLALARRYGLDEEQIVLDPGLGFAKTAEQNYEILRELESFHELGRPLLLGPSRKSFIGLTTGRAVSERESGTAAAVTAAVLKKIQIIRIHEVGLARDAARVAEAIRGENHVRA